MLFTIKSTSIPNMMLSYLIFWVSTGFVSLITSWSNNLSLLTKWFTIKRFISRDSEESLEEVSLLVRVKPGNRREGFYPKFLISTSLLRILAIWVKYVITVLTISRKTILWSKVSINLMWWNLGTIFTLLLLPSAFWESSR